MRKKLTHKFGAVRCEIDNQKFPSKGEGKYYLKLCHLKEKGEVLFFLRQVRFPIIETEINGKKEKIEYVCDFMVFWANGEVTVEDYKGVITPMYKLKKKLIESMYPFNIIERTIKDLKY